MITLFVGGSHDGARLEIDEARKEVRLPVIESFAMGSITVETKETDLYRSEHYVRWTNNDKSISVFALNHMSESDMLRALVYGYRRK